MEVEKGTRLKIFFKIIISMFFSVVILSIITFYYSTSGIATYPVGGGTNSCHEPYSQVHFCTEGIAHFKHDGNGYNNLVVMSPNEMDYLVMGSSHMHAFQVCQNCNFSYLLNELLDGDVYNIGMGGHYLAKSLSNLEDALNYYNPRKALILEIPSVTENVSRLEKVNNGESLNEPIGLNSAFWRFIKKHVSFIPRAITYLEDWASVSSFDKSEATVPVYDDAYWAVVDEALMNASDFVHDKGLDFYILIHPSVSIDEIGNVKPIDNLKEIDAFEAICNRHDIVLINPYDKFVEEYETEHKLPNGFINTAVGGGHMNEVGHRLSAEAAIEAIEAREAR